MNRESDRPREPERLSGVLGVGFGLLLIAGLAMTLLQQRTREVDAAAEFAARFEPVQLPYGLQPRRAAVQSDGQRQVFLERLDPASEAPKAAAPAVETEKESGAPEVPFDWSALAIGAPGEEPLEGLLVTFPRAGARARLESLFGGMGKGFDRQGGGPGRMSMPEMHGSDPLAGLSAQGGRRVIERGRLGWGEFEAPYAIERDFEPGGTFVDSLRTNLSSETEAVVLFLRWSRGFPASKERAEEFLAALRRAAPAG